MPAPLSKEEQMAAARELQSMFSSSGSNRGAVKRNRPHGVSGPGNPSLRGRGGGGSNVAHRSSPLRGGYSGSIPSRGENNTARGSAGGVAHRNLGPNIHPQTSNPPSLTLKTNTTVPPAIRPSITQPAITQPAVVEPITARPFGPVPARPGPFGFSSATRSAENEDLMAFADTPSPETPKMPGDSAMDNMDLMDFGDPQGTHIIGQAIPAANPFSGGSLMDDPISAFGTAAPTPKPLGWAALQPTPAQSRESRAGLFNPPLSQSVESISQPLQARPVVSENTRRCTCAETSKPVVKGLAASRWYTPVSQNPWIVQQTAVKRPGETSCPIHKPRLSVGQAAASVPPFAMEVDEDEEII